MAIIQPAHLAGVTFITPECEAPDCSVSGDQYTMVRCRGCKAWFCPEHVAVQEGVTLVRPAPRTLLGLAYFEGLCHVCLEAQQRSTCH
jgi:hypothetical protein